MQIDLTEPQSDFFVADNEYLALVAGVGSGKTNAACAKLMSLKLKYPTVDLAYYAPSYPLIRDIFYPRISEILADLKIRFKINKSEHNIYIQGYGKFICRSMDNPDSIIGYEVGSAVMDEFDTLPKAKAITVMEKVSARCRTIFPDGSKNSKMVTTTPEGFKGTYELFKKDPLEDSRIIQMSTYSNPHLPPGFVESRLAQYPKQLVSAYILGDFVNMVSGAVYPFFDRDVNFNNRTIQPGEPLDIGLDLNVGKMSAVIFAPFDGKKLEIIGEMIGYADTPSLINAMKDRLTGHKLTIYPDASSSHRNTTGVTQTDLKLLKLAGFKVKALKSNPLVKERVQSVNVLFEKGFLTINKKTAPETLECIEQQAYDRNGVPDKSLDLDHPLDALGYRVCHGWLISKTMIDYKKAVA